MPTLLFYAKDSFQRAIWGRLMVETLQLYRAGEIKAPPMEVFDVTRVSQAYRFFANKNRVGKVVISMEDPQAHVPVAPATYLSLFNPDKVCLLIGYLGGLGRSLSRWMMTRSARNFVFLGRSGADKPSAQQLVSRLEQTGATVGVVRGDVSQAADVTAAVSACLATGRQIGGVVQAAMGLHEALFTRMTNEAWYVVPTPICPSFSVKCTLLKQVVVTDTEHRAGIPALTPSFREPGTFTMLWKATIWTFSCSHRLSLGPWARQLKAITARQTASWMLLHVGAALEASPAYRSAWA